MTAHEIVIRLGRTFDVQFRGEHSGAPFEFSTAAEIAVPFADRESAEAAMREIELSVRPVHDAGGEDYRPVVAGEVVRSVPELKPGGNGGQVARNGPSITDCLEAAMRADPTLTVEEAIRPVPISQETIDRYAAGREGAG